MFILFSLIFHHFSMIPMCFPQENQLPFPELLLRVEIAASGCRFGPRYGIYSLFHVVFE